MVKFETWSSCAECNYHVPSNYSPYIFFIYLKLNNIKYDFYQLKSHNQIFGSNYYFFLNFFLQFYEELLKMLILQFNRLLLIFFISLFSTNIFEDIIKIIKMTIDYLPIFLHIFLNFFELHYLSNE